MRLALRKGDVALAASLVLYAAGWLIYINVSAHAGEIIRTAGEASIIGGLCDYLALKMLFERRWYLPNSGVLPRNRQRLVAAIGETVENDWLTPETIHRRLTEYDFATRIGGWLEQLSLRGEDLAFVDQLAHRIADSLREPEVMSRIVREVRKTVPAMLRWLPLGFEEKLLRMAETLPDQLSELVRDPAFRRHLETELHLLGAQLQKHDSVAREYAEAWVERLLNAAIGASRGEIARLVVENLGRLTDEQIRVQIESKTRPHLEWIRVNGSLFGALFGLVAAFLHALPSLG
jgi:uncharacterized membrane-anchored protein YjiN (DUF445 family)